MIEYNMKTFGNVAIGIHGKELPKFSQTQNLQEYWKQAKDYADNPGVSSRLELKQSHKYWAKPDQLLISSVHENMGPVDPFKVTHCPKEAKHEICQKVNEINCFKHEAQELAPGPATGSGHTRWTEVVHHFAPKRGAYEEDPNMRQSLLRYEQESLPSSFSPSGIFQDPLNKIKSAYFGFA